MQIIVEIGTPEQKVSIENELTDFQNSFADFGSVVNVSKIIIASNYEETVNGFLKEGDFKSIRGTEDNPIVGLGRILQDNESYVIVFAPQFYCEAFDSQIRYYLFLHEVAHIINKSKLRFPETTNNSNDIYLHDMYYFYDEYMADRNAYHWHDLVVKEKSNLWKIASKSFIEGFSNIINDEKYYIAIRNELDLFKTHGNADRFLVNVKPYVYAMIGSITHLYSYIHHYHIKSTKYNIKRSHFIKSDTIKLMELYRNSYYRKAHNLDEFIPIMVRFMKCFGIIHEDFGEMLWVHAPSI